MKKLPHKVMCRTAKADLVDSLSLGKYSYTFLVKKKREE